MGRRPCGKQVALSELHSLIFNFAVTTL